MKDLDFSKFCKITFFLSFSIRIPGSRKNYEPGVNHPRPPSPLIGAETIQKQDSMKYEQKKILYIYIKIIRGLNPQNPLSGYATGHSDGLY